MPLRPVEKKLSNRIIPSKWEWTQKEEVQNQTYPHQLWSTGCRLLNSVKIHNGNANLTISATAEIYLYLLSQVLERNGSRTELAFLARTGKLYFFKGVTDF